jgi:hypothetical protein
MDALDDKFLAFAGEGFGVEESESSLSLRESSVAPDTPLATLF